MSTGLQSPGLGQDDGAPDFGSYGTVWTLSNRTVHLLCRRETCFDKIPSPPLTFDPLVIVELSTTLFPSHLVDAVDPVYKVVQVVSKT